MFATIAGQHGLCVLSVVLVVYHELALEVRCRSYRSIMLPTLGGYIREVALFALCCAILLIAGPVWVIYCFFEFCTVTPLLCYDQRIQVTAISSVFHCLSATLWCESSTKVGKFLYAKLLTVSLFVITKGFI